MSHRVPMLCATVIFFAFIKSPTAAPVSIDAIQANRHPAKVSTSYQSWFPVRLSGMETGPLAYAVRVKNTGDTDLLVRVEVVSYLKDGEEHRAGLSAMGEVMVKSHTDLPLVMQPPRDPGRYTATIELSYQTRGLFGAASPFGWKDAETKQVSFEVVDAGTPLATSSSSKPVPGIIKPVKTPYVPSKEETGALAVTAIAETLQLVPVFGALAQVLSPASTSIQAKMQPALLASCLVVKNPKIDELEKGGGKQLHLSAYTTSARTGAANFPTFRPSFDRVVFMVEGPGDLSFPSQEGWSVERAGDKQLAMTVVDGMDKQLGHPMVKEFREPSVSLRYTDYGEEGEAYTLKVMALGLIGPFGKAAEADQVTEPSTKDPVLLKTTEDLGNSVWIYDLEQWQRTPEKAVWYCTSMGTSKVTGKRSKLEGGLPAELAGICEVPTDGKDAYGNPVRNGLDPTTGWPLEVRHKATGMHLVFIPAGEFMMGSPKDEKDRDDDETQHRVKLTRPFYLGKYEVTQGEWTKVMAAEPWKGEPYAKEDSRHAVTYVSWEDCHEFVKKAGPALRLPTESEWEYGCRAGSQTRFNYGNDADYSQLKEYAWFRDNGWDANEKYAHRVGEKKPNAWGLYDIHGNVWEWCQDRYGAYPNEAATNPVGPTSGSLRVRRGLARLRQVLPCCDPLRERPGSPLLQPGLPPCLVPSSVSSGQVQERSCKA